MSCRAIILATPSSLRTSPVACPADTPLARAAADAVAAVTGSRPVPGGVPYFTEACVFVPRLGIPMVICGPGLPTMAHQPDEYVELRQVTQAAEIYVRIVSTLLGAEVSG